MNQSNEASGRSAAYRIGRGMLGTVPIVLAGSMAVSMNLTGPLFAADHVQPDTDKPGVSPAPTTEMDLSAVSSGHEVTTMTADVSTGATIETASAPTTYRVVAGDTVASIAGRYGLSTASVLALNGLSWKSTIYPGQTLHLTASRATPAPAAHTASAPSGTSASIYTIVRGDTMSSVATKHHVSTQALLSANGLGWSSIVYPGQRVRIPGSSSSASAPVATHATSASTSTPSAGSGSYTIKTGDTLTSIAKSHGITVENLLAANHLSWTSTIYAGKKLAIPSSAPTAVAAASTGGTQAIASMSLTAEQKVNAATIIRVGRSLGVSDYGIVIALSAAAQESSLRNLAAGDRDSVGLFQQRPSQGWGTRPQLQSTTYAARLFFGGSSNPNAGKSRGLLDIRGWSQMTVTQAAQAVQNSAYPTAYAKWERSARTWLATL